MQRLALAAIILYQTVVSPYLRVSCRYLPTCSHYSYESITQYGLLKGIWLTLRRLRRCHPLGGWGYDPVP